MPARVSVKRLSAHWIVYRQRFIVRSQFFAGIFDHAEVIGIPIPLACEPDGLTWLDVFRLARPPDTLQDLAKAFAARATYHSCLVLVLEIVLVNESVQCPDGSLCVAMFVVVVFVELFGGFDVLNDDPKGALGVPERILTSFHVCWMRNFLFGCHLVAGTEWQSLAGQVALVVSLILWSLIIIEGPHTVVGTAHE